MYEGIYMVVLKPNSVVIVVIVITYVVGDRLRLKHSTCMLCSSSNVVNIYSKRHLGLSAWLCNSDLYACLIQALNK